MISLIFWAIAAIFNGAMDMNFNMYSGSIFSKFGIFFNPYESWRFKWKNGDKAQGERFLGSSTIFVWFTDSWHLFKAVFMTCILAAIFLKSNNYIFGNWYFDLALYAVVWFVCFESTLKILKRKS